MDELPTNDAQTFRVTHAIRRHLPTVVVVTLVCAAVAGAFGFLRPQSYTSSSTVFIQPLLGNALTPRTTDSNQSVTVAMETEANLATSAAVTERVNDALNTTLKDSTTAVAASVPTNTQLVKITYTAHSAVEARRFAQAYAQAYLAQRQQLAKTTVESQLDGLNKQVTNIEALLTAATKDAASAHPAPDASSRVQLYASRLASLQADIGQAQATDTFPGDIAVPAQLPPPAGRLKQIVILLVGAVLGFVLGVLLAAWRERRDDGLHADVEPLVHNLPVLASVRVGGAAERLDESDDGETEDAYRRLRVGVLASAGRKAVLAVSPLSNRENGAEVAVRLARGLAAAGYRVGLVDTTVESPTVDRLLGLGSRSGLSDALLGSEPLEELTVELDGLTVLTAGTDPLAARDRYSGAAIGEVLASLRSSADFIVLSAAPVTTGDGLAAVLAADDVAFVVTDGVTTHEQVADAHDLVNRLTVRILGLIAVHRGHGRRGKGTRAGSPARPAAGGRGGEASDDESSDGDDTPGAEQPPADEARKERANQGSASARPSGAASDSRAAGSAARIDGALRKSGKAGAAASGRRR
jgi:Mrp family chromosome partitioning ATPase/capsular polysaccharide biosynthesis protein